MIRHVAEPLFLCILLCILADDPSAISVEIASCAFLQFDAINLPQPPQGMHNTSPLLHLSRHSKYFKGRIRSLNIIVDRLQLKSMYFLEEHLVRHVDGFVLHSLSELISSLALI